MEGGYALCLHAAPRRRRARGVRGHTTQGSPLRPAPGADDVSAETDLLPSSVAAFTEALKGERGSLDAWLEVNDEREVAAHVEAYARACVAHVTAAKDAEIEALRAEVE